MDEIATLIAVGLFIAFLTLSAAAIVTAAVVVNSSWFLGRLAGTKIVKPYGQLLPAKEPPTAAFGGIIRQHRIEVYLGATAASSAVVLLHMRSWAVTGGTTFLSVVIPVESARLVAAGIEEGLGGRARTSGLEEEDRFTLLPHTLEMASGLIGVCKCETSDKRRFALYALNSEAYPVAVGFASGSVMTGGAAFLGAAWGTRLSRAEASQLARMLHEAVAASGQ